jgi:[glutamine synthetase] adenylyltransferase / [glutamine synthetase]-adenylyl-L-tyrosine phosphorylase
MIHLDFSDVPAQLQVAATRYWETFEKNHTEQALKPLADYLPAAVTPQEFNRHLTRVFIGSEYVANKISLNPPYLIDLLQSGDLYTAQTQAHLDVITQQIKSVASTSELDSLIRQQRHRAMIRLIWRDLNRLARMQEVTSELSRFADLMIQLTAEYHYRDLEKIYGTPRGKHSNLTQPFIVLGMGKLGAGELNISSDIDLIFTFPESGTTDSATHSISNQEFFIKLGQRFIQILDAVTAEGFVFRVDMRLRPHGQSGSLALSFAAMEDYYQTQGREWERYAMIKARSVAIVGGANQEKEEMKKARAELRNLLQPFTYRQYIDFSAIESLREMKALIARQVQRKGMSLDVKLGEGGIREVEFVVQVFQLIRGGRDMALRRRKVLVLLPYLEQQGYLPEGSGAALLEAYIFLRNTEHALQAYQDQQTQSLPTDALAQQRLAWVMGFSDWNAFFVELNRYRESVNKEFKLVIAPPERESSDHLQQSIWLSLWEGSLDGADALQTLSAKQLLQPENLLKQLNDLRLARPIQAMQASSRARLDIFIPQLLELLWKNQQDKKLPLSYCTVLARIIPLVEAIARRSAYLVLLVENPAAIQQLITLCAASPWIADQLTQHPALLDELLSPKNLYAPPDKEQLRDELRHELLRLTDDDLEGQMEALRYFRSAHALRVAASEIAGTLPLMKVSDYLTYIAEVILEQALQFSWQQMIARHGFPQTSDGLRETSPQFVIVGYGKLGGIELSHGSDLDLVFIHNTHSDGQTSGVEAGKGVIDNLTFYTRMAQKIIHLLNTYTSSGKLYEVDMRLRPSGNSGLLVSSLTAFEKYQLKDAWTWEHQALVRARVVAGDVKLARLFELVRHKILCLERDIEKLRLDVSDMRRKMREQLSSQTKSKTSKLSGSETGQEFNLKQDAGGIVDIEFMVQYAALAWAFKVPEIIRYTDNIRILGSLEEAGLLDADSVAHLIAAYKAYRSTGHRLALQQGQQQEAILEGDNHFQTERTQVVDLWHKLLA